MVVVDDWCGTSNKVDDAVLVPSDPEKLTVEGNTASARLPGTVTLTPRLEGGVGESLAITIVACAGDASSD